MKTLKKIKIFTFITTLALLATSCMPDSLTKFQEDQTKKTTDETVSGGSGGTTCTGNCSASFSRITFDQKVSQTMILTLDDASSFVTGGYISCEDTLAGDKTGSVATINGISGNKLYVSILTEAYSSTSREFKSLFVVDGNVDNAQEFGNTKTKIGEIEYTAPLKDPIGTESALGAGFLGTGISMNVSPSFDLDSAIGTVDEAEYANIHFDISPSIRNAPGLSFASSSFCIQAGSSYPVCTSSFCVEDTSITNTTDCTNAGNTWSAGTCPESTNSNMISCLAAGETWIRGGTIYGTPSVAVPSTTYTMTATSTTRLVTTSTIKMSFDHRPHGFGIAQNVLLNVPNTSSFAVGDFISSESGAVGIVLGIFQPTPLLDELIEVKVTKGTFKPEDNLDNKAIFSAQRTYVYTDGAYPYQIRLDDTGLTSSGFIGTNNLVTFLDNVVTSTGGSGFVSYFLELGGNTYLYTAIDSGQFTTGETLTQGLNTATVDNLKGNNVILGLASASAGGAAGLNLTSSDGTSAAMVMVMDDTSTIRTVILSGDFNLTENIDFDNPYVASTGGTISSIKNDSTFYTYNGEDFSLNTHIAQGSSNIVYSLSPGTIIDGITFEDGTFSGSATSPAAKKSFIATASNPYGVATHSFDFAIKDQIRLFDTTAQPSYNLHAAGIGKENAPCRLTEDTLLNGSFANKDIDITCYLDVGEEALHWNGLKLDLKVGNNVCQFVKESPYFLWQYQPGSTNDAGKADIFNSSGAPECVGSEFSTLSAGTIIPTSSVSGSSIESLGDYCDYKYDFQADVAPGDELPNCDQGSYTYTEEVWSYDSATAACSVISNTKVHHCAGNFSACAAGPIKSHAVLTDDNIDNQILTVNYNLGDAGTNSITFDYSGKVSGSDIFSNIWYANYQTSCLEDTQDMDHEEYKLYSSSSSDPWTTDDARDLLAGANPVYTYDCTDGAGTTLGRINLYVRDWDREFTASNLSGSVPATLMDDAGTDDFLVPYNQYRDYNDVIGGSAACDSAGGTPGPDTMLLPLYTTGNGFLKNLFPENSL